MRKYGRVDPRAILTSALLLVILLGMVTHRHKHVAPAVIRFEPALNGAAGDGQDSAFPPSRSRAPQPVKRKIFLPPMIAALETGRLS
jgi:hypothetical protein